MVLSRLAPVALSLALASTGLTPALAQAPAPAAPAVAPLTQELANSIAQEAYDYFYALITMDVTRRQATNYARLGEVNFRGPPNAFIQIREFPPATFRDVVRPNFDTLYSSAWLDLTAGPMVLSVPDTSGPDGRFYLMPMLDMWSNVFASPGTRTTGTGAGHFAIVPPGWAGTLPAGMQLIRATTPFVWIIGRTQANGAADYPVVNRQQDGYVLTPLSRWGQPAQPVTGTVDPGVDMRTPPLETVNRMAPAAYFARAAELLKTQPPGAYDQPILARMSRLGIRAGESFDLAAASPIARAALEQAAQQGVRHIAGSVPHLGTTRNTWLMLTSGMGMYGTDYLRRAAVAMLGLGANLPEDAIYPLTQVASDGHPLSGENRYVLRFPRGQTPPSNAFWSLTLYDNQGFQVANPLNRFAIGDRDSITASADGSTEILVQHEDPGPALRGNWLPAPAGPFNLTLRLYYPQAPAIDGRWVPPAVTMVEGPASAPAGLRLP